jgi:hypothetical protein
MSMKMYRMIRHRQITDTNSDSVICGRSGYRCRERRLFHDHKLNSVMVMMLGRDAPGSTS